MMTCSDTKELLGEYYDGECTPEQSQAMVAHLSSCRKCEQELDELIALSHHIFSKSAAPASAFLWTRVLAGIEARERKHSEPWWVQWRWMSRVTAVAALLVSLGSAYLLKQTALPLDAALQGESNQQSALQLARMQWSSPDDSAALVLEGEPWAGN